MKKVNVKSFVLGATLSASLILGGTTGLAKSTRESIDVMYKNIKLVVNNKNIKFGKDSSGKVIEPFIYKGTTYLPVRAIGEAFGEEVEWDGKNAVVYVGGMEKSYKKLVDEIGGHGLNFVYKYTEKSYKNLILAGKEYETGYNFYTNKSKAHFNLDSSYDTLEFDYGPSDNFYDSRTNLNIYLDNKLYTSLEIHGNDGIKNLKVPVKGVNQVRIERAGKKSYPDVGIGNPKIK